MKNIAIIGFIFVALTTQLFSQRVAFINSAMIRNTFPEAQQAEQRISSFVDEWKREISIMQKNIDNLEFEINKNRLIWTEEEKANKEKELRELREQNDGYAKAKFAPNGEYDLIVRQIMLPVDQKIAAAVQKVANQKNFDIVFDQSVQPLAYVNFKYDLTLDVLKELGVDITEMEKELQEKIQKDPANQKKETIQPRRVSRTKKSQQEQEMERPEEQKQIEPSQPEKK